MTKTIVMAVAALALLVVAGCGTGPEAPTGLTIDASTMTLSWNAVSGATSYTVYRGTTAPIGTGQGNLGTKTVLKQNVTTTTYTDSTAAAGTTYYYQVVAINSDGASPASNEVSATPQSSGIGFAVVVSAAANGITLTWNAVSGASNYNVWRGETSGLITNKTKLTNGIAVQSPFTDTTAIAGVTYYYQVAAVNSSGNEFQYSIETTPFSF